jgi:WD domain, G-beta repeat
LVDPSFSPNFASNSVLQCASSHWYKQWHVLDHLRLGSLIHEAVFRPPPPVARLAIVAAFIMGCKGSKSATGVDSTAHGYVGPDGSRHPQDNSIEPSPGTRRGNAGAAAASGQYNNATAVGQAGAIINGQSTIQNPAAAVALAAAGGGQGNQGAGIFNRLSSALPNRGVSAPSLPAPAVSVLQKAHLHGTVADVVCLPGSTHFLSCGDDRQIALSDWRCSSGSSSLLRSWPNAHGAPITKLCYLSGRGCFASASKDRTVKIWSLGAAESDQAAAATPLATLVGHDLSVTALAYSFPPFDDVDDPSSGSATARLATGSRDTTVRVWDLNHEGRSGPVCLFRGHKPQNMVTCLKWYNQDLIFQGSEDLRVRLWDTRCSGHLKEVQCLEGYVYYPLSMDISRCGRYLLTTSKGFNGVGGEAKLWDLRGGKGGDMGPPNPQGRGRDLLSSDHFSDPAARAGLVEQYSGHLQDATACAFLPWPASPDFFSPPPFITASRDGTLKLWNAESGEIMAEHCELPDYAPITSLSVIPPSRPMSSSGDGNDPEERHVDVGCPPGTVCVAVAGLADGRVSAFAVVSSTESSSFVPLARTAAVPSATMTPSGGQLASETYDYQRVAEGLQGKNTTNRDYDYGASSAPLDDAAAVALTEATDQE